MAANLKREKDIYHRDQFTVRDQFLTFATFAIPLISRWSLPLKVPKCEILDRSDFPDFYTIKSLRVGDFGVKIKNLFKNI
jgi:hypothetical protein